MSSNRRLFIKKIGTGTVGLSILSTLPYCSTKETKSEETNNQLSGPFALPRSTPEQQGISSAGISNFLNEIAKSGLQFHGLMILRHGHVVAEGWWNPYGPQLKHQLYSLSKSFTSTAIGFAVTEGLLKVEDKVISFFPDEVPDEISENLGKLTVKHLLTMNVGRPDGSMAAMRESENDDWVKTFLNTPIENEPGTVFVYDTGATFMLSAIVQKLTGEKLIDYLTPRLFEPLDIHGMDWMENPQGINTGGYGLRLKTEDIAKFGQLYLQKGRWNGTQIIAPKWVEVATSKQTPSNSSAGPGGNGDWDQGYGYKFWRNTVGGFRADGAYGQFSIVLPEKDLVVAINEQSFNMGDSMKLVWNYLLPAIQDGTLSENREAQEHLQQELKSLSLVPPKMDMNSPTASLISGKEYILDENEFKVKSVSFNFSQGQCNFSVKEKDRDLIVTCGMNQWHTGDNEKPVAECLFPVPGRLDFPSKIAASATWKDEKTLLLTWQFIETCHGDNLECTFEDDSISIKFLNSVAKGKDEEDPRTEIKGKASV